MIKHKNCMTRHFLFIYVILNKKKALNQKTYNNKNIRKMFEIKQDFSFRN